MSMGDFQDASNAGGPDQGLSLNGGDAVPIFAAGAENPADVDQSALRFAATQDAVLCTIVGLTGSFSRRCGAQFAVATNGETMGSLSDGCLEAELVAQSKDARLSGSPRILRYGEGSPFVDFRLPCGAGVDILVDPWPDRQRLHKAVAQLDARQPAQLHLPVTDPALLQHRDYLPSCRLIALGSGAEMDELARLAKVYGMDVQLRGPGRSLDMGRAPTDLPVDPWTAVLLLFHDHDWEGPILDWALESDAFYVGAIGGQRTRSARREMLQSQGYSPAQITRVRSPIGLIPNARDPRTLALSVLADVVGSYETLRG